MESGLICAYRLDGRGGAEELGWPELRDWRPEQGAAWVHLQYEREDARHWLEAESGLDGVVVDALTAEQTRPRVEAYADGLLVMLRGVNTNPGAEPEDMVSLRMWLEPGRIVTTRQRRLASIEGVREALARDAGPTDPAGFLAEVVERLVGLIGEVAEEIDGQLLEQEEAALASSGAVPELSELRRRLIRLRRFLAPQRDALMRLQTAGAPWLDEERRLLLRESGNLLTRYVEDLEAARERATVAHEELLSRQSESLNRRMYLLSLVTGLFLPLSFITGLLGINVAGIPGADLPWGFAAVVGLLTALTGLMLAAFKWWRWF